MNYPGYLFTGFCFAIIRINLIFRPQHLTGLQLVSNICRGELENAQVGSTDVTFRPGTIKAGKFVADSKTAG